MENGRKFGQESGFNTETQRPRHVDEFILAPNNRLIIKGESRKKSKPIPGTSQRRNANQGRRGR